MGMEDGKEGEQMPRLAGHHEGMQVVKKITKFASKLNVKVLTSFMRFFNWELEKDRKRNVDYLMKLQKNF